MSRLLVCIKTASDREKIATWAKNAPVNSTVEFRSPRRSSDQNSLMWSLLTQVSRNVIWYGEKLSPDDWKDIFSASLRKAHVVPGIDAGTKVPLGMRTSQMTKDEISALIELIYAFGAEHEVKFRELELTNA
jgi:hypothetical protein